MLSEIRLSQVKYYDSMYVRHREQSNSQKVKWRLPGLGGSVELFKAKFQFCRMKSCGNWLHNVNTLNTYKLYT